MTNKQQVQWYSGSIMVLLGVALVCIDHGFAGGMLALLGGACAWDAAG